MTTPRLFASAVIAAATFATLDRASAACPSCDSPRGVVAAIEAVHGKSAWYAKDAVEVDLTVEGFGGLKLDGTMLFTPSLGRVRFALKDGTTLYYDHDDAWMTLPEGVDPASAMPPAMARFHVLTWPYFVAVPFKLSDPGVLLSGEPSIAVTGPEDRTDAVKLTFAAGTGDAPDDWYYLLRDEHDRLTALSYIVTYSKPQEEAEEQPSVVLYDDFRTQAGVTLPYQWTFHLWNKQAGVQGDTPKGTATVHAVRYVTPSEDAFAAPEGATPLPAP